MDKQMKDLISCIGGKTIAIVYVFEKEDSEGYSHYDVWKSDVLSSWLNAIQELKCAPYIMDIRTFVYKAMNRSLPVIDYVINLNNGNIDISTLGLVPSVCSFLSIPCIPCNTVSIIVGEHKMLSNLIAYSQGMNIPKELDRSIPNGITRPFNLGSSRGVKRGYQTNENIECFYQEFIQGVDITTPLLYNPMTKEIEVLPTILYYPFNEDTNWFLNENEKESHMGYEKRIIHVDNLTQEKYKDLARTMSIKTYCRIDSRVRCNSFDEVESIFKEQCIPYDKIHFIEINPMPTIRDEINFHTSLRSLSSGYSMFECLNSYTKIIGEFSYTGFILFCSMVAHLKAKH